MSLHTYIIEQPNYQQQCLNVPLSNTSSVDVQGLSLFTIPFQGVFLSTFSSVDMQGANCTPWQMPDCQKIGTRMEKNAEFLLMPEPV